MTLMLLTLPLIILDLPYALLVAMGKIAQQNIVTFIGLVSFVILALIAVKLNLGLTGVVGASLLGRVVRLIMVYGFLVRTNFHEKNLELIKKPG